MPSIKFTSRTIEAIRPPEAGQVDYWDKTVPGFGLRVTYRNRKTWVLMYRHEQRKRRLTLGTYPAMALSDARGAAKAASHSVALGQDPAGDKQAKRKAETFAEVAEEYIELHAKKKKRSWRKDRQALDRDLLPRFGNRKAADLTRKEIRQLLSEIADRGAPILANRTLEIVRKIYNWAIEEEIIDANPATGIKKPSEETTRDRVLDNGEIVAVWAATGEEAPLMAAMFKLRLITAQRGNEISRMRWTDIDGAWWTIPAEHSKNGYSHRVWLSECALAILQELKSRSGKSEWVFPSPTGAGAIGTTWKAGDRIRRRSCVDFVPHDMRRTAASRMTGDLEISRLTVSKILNHVESGVTSVYDRHSYDREKREALDAWGRRLMEIVTGKAARKNVVPLRAQTSKTGVV